MKSLNNWNIHTSHTYKNHVSTIPSYTDISQKNVYCDTQSSLNASQSKIRSGHNKNSLETTIYNPWDSMNITYSNNLSVNETKFVSNLI